MVEQIHVYEMLEDSEEVVEREPRFHTSFLKRDFPGYEVATVTVNHKGTHIYIKKEKA